MGMCGGTIGSSKECTGILDYFTVFIEGLEPALSFYSLLICFLWSRASVSWF